MRTFMNIAAALADENRVRVLLALGQPQRGTTGNRGELCVCQITELLGLAPSTASKHLSILAQAELITGRKIGRWMFYRLAGDGAPPAARAALAWVQAHAPAEVARADASHLKAILKEDPEELCRRQCGRACCSSAPATRAAARWPKAGPAPSKAT